MVDNRSQSTEFEKAVADFVRAKYAVAVCNGTAALHAVMFAIGVGPGDEVSSPNDFCGNS